LPLFKLVNIRGDLFATASSFGLQTVIRLGSSLILTRILLPEAYGVITIMLSIAFVLEMLSDINVSVFIIREKNAEQARYLNTAWTIRLARASINCLILLLFAPLIANSLYHTPVLATPLRVYSVAFIIGALESMSFPLAIRRKQARIFMWSELIASATGNSFAVIYTYYSRDYWGIIFGILVSRTLLSSFSYAFYKDSRPRVQFDRAVAREIFQFGKFNAPSSLLTLAMSQFDKVVFLRLFDLSALGVYGLAANISGAIESLISRVSQSVLYPRCAHNFRAHPDSVGLRYYTDNVRLFAGILFLPAAVGGAAYLIIAILYPNRYAEAGVILQAFMLRATLLALGSPSEDLLIATGRYQVILHGNVFRAAWMFIASLTGYYFFGFMGFVYGAALSALPPLIYYFWLQIRQGMFIVKYECYRFAFALSIWLSAYLVGRVVLGSLSHVHLHR
jgi:lipopolysaccharide exporter